MSCSGVPSGWALRHAEISSRALVRSSGFSSRNLTARDSMAAGCVKVRSAEPMSRGPDDAHPPCQSAQVTAAGLPPCPVEYGDDHLADQRMVTDLRRRQPFSVFQLADGSTVLAEHPQGPGALQPERGPPVP